MIVTSIYDSPCGQLTLGAIGGNLCICDWNVGSRRQTIDSRLCKEFGATIKAGDDEVLREAKKQLDQYFSRERQSFELPLIFAGGDFRHSIWLKLQSINYGETISYQDFANLLGRPSAVRAVASAIGANPLSIFIPCHRVVGKNGSLTGYAGGLSAKQYLLELEGGIGQTKSDNGQTSRTCRMAAID
ncbi:MAG: methylated-DNA--[protein]-cysteine S-methyltransferase [Muribaculaceae bacterium]|nr:methylated-DNA--[protein]-cysteine S-methyltransferase [Muribaculaceae bacterium]